MAKIYLKGGTEKALILGIRESFYQPFQATNWTDLRVGFFLSVVGPVDPTDDDDPTAVSAEEIGTPPSPLLQWTDRVAIGLTDRLTGATFLGYTNKITNREPSSGTSKLLSSDGAVGTTNAYFWRWKNSLSDGQALKILDGGIIRARGNGNGSEMHLPQDTTGAGGYATLVALRFQRDDARGRSKIITMTCKTGTHSGDILYTNAPSATLLETNLTSFPSTVTQLGPVELSQAPDTIFVYWPFHDSRLRIHAYGILRASST